MEAQYVTELLPIAEGSAESWGRICKQYKFNIGIELGPLSYYGLKQLRTNNSTQNLPSTPCCQIAARRKKKPFWRFRASALRKYPDPVQTLWVIAFRDEVALVQTMDGSNIKILVIDVVSGHVRSTYIPHFPFDYRHADFEAFISPDKTLFLLHRKASLRIAVIKIERETCSFLYFIELFSDCICVAFDPRYRWSRIFISSGCEPIQSFDLKIRNMLFEQAVLSRTHCLCLSPCGSFVFATGKVDGWNMSRARVFMRNSDNLNVLRILGLHVHPYLSLDYFFLMAKVSLPGDHLAVANIDQEVHVYSIPVDITLRNLCRISVRRVVEAEKIQRLPLPEQLKRFLRFDPLYE